MARKQDQPPRGTKGSQPDGKHAGSGPEKGLPERVRCPICRKWTSYAGNPLRPFCSERCHTMDQANWAEGTYAIPTQDTPSSDEDQ
ncbi:MAG: DNA gyrase inhibitor YacG [Deltaproteobacteria bacterium]|nr:DNA gyrase inhibitor YacG [Deltaproteobacteria bacterium]